MSLFNHGFVHRGSFSHKNYSILAWICNFSKIWTWISSEKSWPCNGQPWPLKFPYSRIINLKLAYGLRNEFGNAFTVEIMVHIFWESAGIFSDTWERNFRMTRISKRIELLENVEICSNLEKWQIENLGNLFWKSFVTFWFELFVKTQDHFNHVITKAVTWLAIPKVYHRLWYKNCIIPPD